MARKRRIATVFTYLMLEVGALLGAPIRPDDIETITRLLNQTQVTELAERDAGGDPPDSVAKEESLRGMVAKSRGG
jgi:hypothetical protein